MEIKQHLLDFKWLYIIILVILSLIGFCIYYEYTYPCVSGHYEENLHYSYNPNGTIQYTYWQNDFICDCRTIRDSIK